MFTVGGAVFTVGGAEFTVGGAVFTVGGAEFTVGGAAFTVGGACLQKEEHINRALGPPKWYWVRNYGRNYAYFFYMLQYCLYARADNMIYLNN